MKADSLVTVTSKIGKQEREWLRRHCESTGNNVSEIIRELLRYYQLLEVEDEPR